MNTHYMVHGVYNNMKSILHSQHLFQKECQNIYPTFAIQKCVIYFCVCLALCGHEVSMYLVKSNLIPFLLTLVQLSKTDSCGSLRKISNISRARLPRFRKIDSRTQYSLQFLLKADLQCYQKNHSQSLVVRKILQCHLKRKPMYVPRIIRARYGL